MGLRFTAAIPRRQPAVDRPPVSWVDHEIGERAMTKTTKSDTGSGCGAVSVALFLCLFAGQAALITMSPVLADAASDLHVSTAAAGQLRTIAGEREMMLELKQAAERA
jgi:hypothetical protein